MTNCDYCGTVILPLAKHDCIAYAEDSATWKFSAFAYGEVTIEKHQ